MRVINDRRPENDQAPDIGFFSVAVHALFCALGILFPVIAPLPMIAAHFQMTEPWSKISAMFGAVFALTLLAVPLAVVVPTFVLGLFVSDRVARGTPFWKLLMQSVLLGSGLAAAGLVYGASLMKMELLPYWAHLANGFVDELKQANGVLALNSSLNWEALKQALYHSGPFLVVAGIISSFWLSVGLAAHLGFVPPRGNPYSGEELRKLRVPNTVSALFVAAFLADLLGLMGSISFLPGLMAVLGSFMFIQGTVFLSDLFARRSVQGAIRTLIYCLMVLNVYAVVGLGIVSPWFLRRRAILEEKL